MLISSFPHEVTILRPSEVADDYGNVLSSWDRPGRVLSRAYFRVIEGLESISSERSNVETAYRLYLPSDSDIRVKDRVEIGEAVFEVDGVPTVRSSPLSGVSFLTATLRRWEG